MLFEPGDVLAFYGRKPLAATIRTVTAGGPSHVAIVCRHRGRPLMVESTTLSERTCDIMGTHTTGVQGHFLDDSGWLAACGSQVWMYRLRGSRQLTDYENERLKNYLYYWITKETPYDYLGAAWSATRLLKRFWMLGADMHKQFCSELVVDGLQLVRRFSDYYRANLYSPANVVRGLERGPYYDAAERVA